MTTQEGLNIINTPSFENINQININDREEESPIYKFISENGIYFTKCLNSSKNKLIFKLNIPDSKKNFYSNEYSYEDLSKICPLFTIEENIEGIDQLITESINNFGIKTSQDGCNESEINLIIQLSINSKTKEIKIKLNKADLSEEDLMTLLMDKVNNLLRERNAMYGVKTFKQVSNELHNKKEKLDIKLVELEKKIDKIANIYQNLKEINLLVNSNIINDSKEINLIVDALKENKKKGIGFILRSKKSNQIKNDKKFENIIFKLVYRASRDGDTAEEFHKRCDDIGPNITLVKTDKDIKFGGFTNYNWEVPKEANIVENAENSEFGVDKEDDNSFCFSLSSNKIYPHISGKGAIFCCKNYGPTFSDNIFAIYDKMLSNGGYSGKIERSNFDGQEKDYEISGEEKMFKIKELEVFEIENIYY